MRRVDRIHYCRHPSDAYVDSPQPIGTTLLLEESRVAEANRRWTNDLCPAHARCGVGNPEAESHVPTPTRSPELTHDRPGASVLDVGSGSGYLAACFARMIGTGRVVGIEVNQRLVDWGRSNVEKADGDLLKSGVLELHVGDGWRGWPARAPYDAIHVGAAAESTESCAPTAFCPWLRCVTLILPCPNCSQACLLRWLSS